MSVRPKKTACRNGHPRKGNWRQFPSGRWYCRACHLANDKRYKARHPDRVRKMRAAYATEYYKRHSDVIKATVYRWRRKNRLRYNEYQRLYKQRTRKT